jgi:hypothetical protein
MTAALTRFIISTCALPVSSVDNVCAWTKPENPKIAKATKSRAAIITILVL